MSSISGVSGSSGSYFPQTGGTQRRERDTSKIAENVFSKLDTKNQGYLEVSDLESAFGNIASSSSTSTASTSSSDTSTSSTSTSGNSATINDLFKKLDSDGDGKVTKSEFSNGIKKLGDALETQFNARRTRGAEGSRPPPPSPPEGGGGADQTGLDKTQLTDLSAEVGKTNSSAGAALNQVAQNFDAADTNQDGKVSLQETLAYLEKTSTSQTGNTSTTASVSNTNSASSNSSTTSNSGITSSSSSTSDGTTSSVTGNSSTNTDAALFKKALQLLRAYSSPPTSSSSQSISVSA
ncbi:EF-hand domain-containing protein [Undibacterium sp. Ji42W]|uniref:EF-hand domain-containing protein n=1 Tax=Undibacterium sp. Ji42W TaxID=3413039 RepID=UPI003BF4026B